MFDSGVVQVCALTNTAAPGAMPVEALTVLDTLRFEERTVGMTRYYAAQGVNQRVDLLIRVWFCPAAQGGGYAVLTDSSFDGQYRILQVQHRLDADGLRVTDLSLSRLEDNYEIVT